MLTVPSLAPTEKQERLMFEWAQQRRYDVTSIASTPEAARALAEAGLVEVIIVVAHTAATYEMRGHAVHAGVRVDELREGAYMRRLAAERQREQEIAERVAQREQEIAERAAKREQELLAHHSTSTARMIVAAARRGVPPEQIAIVLDVPEATVFEAIGKWVPDEIDAALGNDLTEHRRAPDRSRRAREVTHPAGRR